MFRVAQEHAPSIIFIDEIDAVATKRFPICLPAYSDKNEALAERRYDTTSGGEKEIQRTMQPAWVIKKAVIVVFVQFVVLLPAAL